jgi:hypothetical protein
VREGNSFRGVGCADSRLEIRERGRESLEIVGLAGRADVHIESWKR